MATKSRRKSTSVRDKLFLESYRFSFFQAARLLQGLVKDWYKKTARQAVGHDSSPGDEAVKFSSYPSLKFASSEIAGLKKDVAAKQNQSLVQAEMQVSFMGLTGQSSVLPVYFTELEINRIREKDYALKQFYDLFNHRSISFFYRAWEKYRLPFSYERKKLEAKANTDVITTGLESLLGINGKCLQRALPVNSEDLIFYAGFFSSPSRSASSLEAALSEILDVPVNVNQFKGEWMPLLEEDRLQLPTFPLSGKNNCLGVDTVIGDEVFTVEGKFQLALGPLNRKQFESLQPGTQGLKALKDFTRLFVGDSFQFELKYILKDEAIIAWDLDEVNHSLPRLGLNTWLLPENIEDAKREIVVSI